MYAAFDNQAIHILSYAIAYLLVFLVIPRLIFTRQDGGYTDRAARNYIKITVLLIILGYLLVLLKLFELLALLAIFIVMFLYSFIKRNSLEGWDDLLSHVQLRIFEYAEGRRGLKNALKGWLNHFKLSCHRLIRCCFGGFTAAGTTLLFAVMLIYSAYLRFLDAFIHAAPAMSDAYVTLAWMKYINRRILFHDGIYPQGFHIILAVIHKFTSIDALYVLRYTGPLNGVITTLAIYCLVSGLTKRRMPGILSGGVFGILGMYLHLDWVRQASTNSQEFAFIFIFPFIYYLLSYLRQGEKEDFWIASAALGVMGLVHTVAFAFAGLCVFIAILTVPLLRSKGIFKKVLNLCLMGMGTVMLALLPLAIGMLMGKDFHGSSADYLISQSTFSIPALIVTDYFALAAIVLMMLYFMFNRRSMREKQAYIYLALLGVATFCLYRYGGVITNSTVIASRSGTLWALMIPVLIGMGYHVVSSVLSFYKDRVPEVLVSFGLLASLVVFLRPVPIIPYKMDYDSAVEQYLRIRNGFRPTEWMIVSQEEGYAMVLGTGYHLMMQDWLSWYDPETEELYSIENGENVVLETPDIFIYQEKKVFDTEFESMREIYERRIKEMEVLEEWLFLYCQKHDNISVYYEDDNLKIWHIHQPQSKEERREQLWGGLFLSPQMVRNYRGCC